MTGSTLDAHLALAQRRILAACWTAPEAFRDEVAHLQALVALAAAAHHRELTCGAAGGPP